MRVQDLEFRVQGAGSRGYSLEFKDMFLELGRLGTPAQSGRPCRVLHNQMSCIRHLQPGLFDICTVYSTVARGGEGTGSEKSYL